MLKMLDAFSFEAQPDFDHDAVLQVLRLPLSWMACCQHDYRVRFVTPAELVTMLVKAHQ